MRTTWSIRGRPATFVLVRRKITSVRSRPQGRRSSHLSPRMSSHREAVLYARTKGSRMFFGIFRNAVQASFIDNGSAIVSAVSFSFCRVCRNTLYPLVGSPCDSASF